MTTLHETREEADFETEFLGDAVNIEETEALKPTAKLEERLGMKSYLDCFDHLLVVYGEEETDYDGVWWEDEYGHMSAPRGVIFPSRLEAWKKREIDRGGFALDPEEDYS